MGYTIRDFHPAWPWVGDWEASLRGIPPPALVWVPCFRQRDVQAAARWARRHRIPLLFDPLISSYQKRVFERGRVREGSSAAKRLLEEERALFACADVVVADTPEHAAFYRETLGVPDAKLATVFVGADDGFSDVPPAGTRGVLDVLFYGSFLPLHGVQTIIEAARLSNDSSVRWTLLGDGPEKEACVTAAAGLANVRFEPSIPYANLPSRIHAADVLLGVFGDTRQAARVMPNKFFQAIASGRPIVTRTSSAYPPPACESPAVAFVPPNDAHALLDAVMRWRDDATRAVATRAARPLFDAAFSPAVIQTQLARALAQCLPTDAKGEASKPLVSIAIPVYNVAPYLRRCLNSILEQTYQTFEIICVNDGSTDNSLDILNEYGSLDKRVRVYSQTNRGVAATRNRLLDLATGEFLMFVDPDDFIPSYAVETFLDVILETHTEVAVSRVFAKNKMPIRRADHPSWRLVGPGLKQFNRHPMLRLGAGWNKIFRTTCIKKYRFNEDIVYEDWPLMTELFGHLDTFALIEEPLYVYCTNGGSITQSTFTLHKAKSFFTGILHVLSVFKNHPMRKEGIRRAAVSARMLVKKTYKSKDLSIKVFLVEEIAKESRLVRMLLPHLSPKTLWRLFRIYVSGLRETRD